MKIVCAVAQESPEQVCEEQDLSVILNYADTAEDHTGEVLNVFRFSEVDSSSVTLETNETF